MVRTEPILLRFRCHFIYEQSCPECLGYLDSGYECTYCHYDAMTEWMDYRDYLRHCDLLEEYP